jgi:hypothetical protein
MPYLVNNLGPQYVYLFFGAMSTVGTLFHFIIIKETAHLTDKEKKSLYIPKRIKDKMDKQYHQSLRVASAILSEDIDQD